MIKIAHAVYDENGKSVGGKAGDQTGKEVCIWDWYKSGTGWTHVFRAKSAYVAKKISRTAQAIAANDKIGYNQADRLSLYNATKICDVASITKACNCDCSSMVAVCINKAGVAISPSMYTGNQLAAIKATGKFKILTDKKYLTGPDQLQDGDILYRPGHTAVAVNYIPIGPIIKTSEPIDIKWLQHQLNEQIYAGKIDCKTLAVDGAYGNKTAGAVRLWQEYKKWKVGSGFYVGQNTVKSLAR